MIIQLSDFEDRPYKIPNQNEARDLSYLLETWERDIAQGTLDGEKCCKLLGIDLWEEFNDAATTSGSIEARWLRLRDGATYEFNGKTYTYAGWAETIKPAIYALWIPTTTYKLTNIGFVENSAPDKSTLMDDQYPFVVMNWNRFVGKVGNCYNWGENSLYGFLSANKADYPTWSFCAPKLKNRYDF